MKKGYRIIGGFLLIAMAFVSCKEDDNESLVLPEEVYITGFSINGVAGTIDPSTNEIRVVMPAGTGLDSLAPQMVFSEGASVTPASGEVVNFKRRKIVYTVSAGNLYNQYSVKVTKERGNKVAFIGWEDLELSSTDEEAAWEWLQSSGMEAEKVSLYDFQSDYKDIDDYAAIWWHCDGMNNSLPFRAYETKVIALFKDYLANGGGLLLTSRAVKWVKQLGITADANEPNNVYGDNDERNFVDENMGIAIVGNATHPLFEGLDEDSDYFIPLLSAGVSFRNHTTIWHTGWQGYDSSLATWKEKTGGLPLVTDVDNGAPRILLAEFPRTEAGRGPVICIGVAAYDWHIDGDNSYLPNIRKLTENAIQYIR